MAIYRNFAHNKKFKPRGSVAPRHFFKLPNRFTKKLMKLKETAFNQRRQFKVEYVSHSPNLRRMQDGNPLHLKIYSAHRYLYRASTGKLTFHL